MMIRMNEGTTDRALRMVVGAVLGGVCVSGILSGVPAGIALATSLVLLLAGAPVSARCTPCSASTPRTRARGRATVGSFSESPTQPGARAR